MTPDQIKAMSDDELTAEITKLLSRDGVHCYPKYDYSTDLNAAWGLQFGPDGEVLEGFPHAMFTMHGTSKHHADPRRCARLICEAWLYLKTKGEQ